MGRGAVGGLALVDEAAGFCLDLASSAAPVLLVPSMVRGVQGMPLVVEKFAFRRNINATFD